MRIWIRNNPFADWNTKEICGFVIWGLIITNYRICDLLTGTPKKFADLQLQNEPQEFADFQFADYKIDLRAHLWM